MESGKRGNGEAGERGKGNGAKGMGVGVTSDVKMAAPFVLCKGKTLQLLS